MEFDSNNLNEDNQHQLVDLSLPELNLNKGSIHPITIIIEEIKNIIC